MQKPYQHWWGFFHLWPSVCRAMHPTAQQEEVPMLTDTRLLTTKPKGRRGSPEPRRQRREERNGNTPDQPFQAMNPTKYRTDFFKQTRGKASISALKLGLKYAAANAIQANKLAGNLADLCPKKQLCSHEFYGVSCGKTFTICGLAGKKTQKRKPENRKQKCKPERHWSMQNKQKGQRSHLSY